MADRVEYFAVVIPTGTTPANPFSKNLIFAQGNVTEIDVRIPGGPVGLMGFQINAGGTQYVPRTQGEFIVEDDNYLRFPLDSAINSGDWSLTGFNTGSFPHTVYLTFMVNELTTPTSGPAYIPGASASLVPQATSGF